MEKRVSIGSRPTMEFTFCSLLDLISRNFDQITSKSPSFDDILQCDIIVECDEKPIGGVLEVYPFFLLLVGNTIILAIIFN